MAMSQVIRAIFDINEVITHNDGEINLIVGLVLPIPAAMVIDQPVVTRSRGNSAHSSAQVSGIAWRTRTFKTI